MGPSTLPAALATNPKFIFFTDFDGTITQQDSNDYLTDFLGFGPEKRAQGNEDVLFGRRTFRASFTDMLDSIHAPFPECISLLRQKITIDPYFVDFYAWCREHNVPVVVLSGGMRPIIHALLEGWLGEEGVEGLQIVSSDVEARPGKSIEEVDGWRIAFHDDSGYGHDKSIELRKYSTLPEGQRPVLFYAGDGVSDLSAARESDLMFAKRGKQLVTYCKTENIPFTEFDDFSSISSTVKDIVEGKVDLGKVVKAMPS